MRCIPDLALYGQKPFLALTVLNTYPFEYLSRSHFIPQVLSEREFCVLLTVSSETVKRMSVCDPFGPVDLSGKPGPVTLGYHLTRSDA